MTCVSWWHLFSQLFQWRTSGIKQSPAHANAGVYILAGKHNVAVIQAESQKNWHVSCGDICFLNYFTDKPEETSTKSFLVFKFQRSCDIQYNVSATYLVLIFTHGKNMFLEEKKKNNCPLCPPQPPTVTQNGGSWWKFSCLPFRCPVMAHWGRYESKITSNYISGGLGLFWGDLGLFWVVWGNSVKLRFNI